MATPKFKIKRDDTVRVIAGKDRGKVGRVLRVLPKQDRVIVEGVQVVKRHQKPVGDRPGGIVTKEASIHVSNVVLWNAEENRRAKVGYQADDAGRKIRIDRKSGEPLDNA